MTQGPLFTRLLCTSAVGLFSLSAFGADGQTPAAKSPGNQGTAMPSVSIGASAGQQGIAKPQASKIDDQQALKAAILAKYPNGVPSEGGSRGANDNCADSILIACGDTVVSDNIGATTDLGWPCAAGGSEVWYRFVATDPVVNLVFCDGGTTYDSSVAVVDGCGGAVLGCNDDACGLQSTLSVGGLTVGNTYLIAVGGFASQTGNFSMAVTCGEIPPPPTCNEAQPGDAEEGEPFGGCATDYQDTFNAGCNSTPASFSPISCGTTVHGESGTFTFGGGAFRDTDWYLVTITSGQTMTLTVNADFASLFGFVSPTACAFIGSPAFGTACVESSVTSACLPPGDYVCFVAPSGFTGVPCGVQYRATLTCEPCEPPPPPTNDNCAGATLITCPTSFAADNFNATNDGLQPSCSFGGAPTNSDVWYQFVAGDTTATISLCAGGSMGDTVVSVYSDCNGTEVACNDDFCGLLSEVVAGGLTVGNTYYIRVAGWNAQTQGTFTLTLACGTIPSCTPAQPGDIEENEPFGGCAPDYVDSFNGGCNSASPVFSPIECGDNIHGESGTFISGGGQFRDTDWWLVTINSGQILTFTVQADFPVLIGFVAQPCPQGAFMNFATAPACTDAIVTSACLPPGDYVCFVAPSGFSGVNCGAQYRGNLSCSPCEPPPPPANNDCSGATLINCGDTIQGNNVNATSDGLLPSCSFNGTATNSDVWYKFVAGAASATFSTCGGGSMTDTVVSVYSDCNGTEIACNDDFCGLLSEVTATGLTSGTTYYVRVAGWGAQAQGTFTLSMTACGATGACCVNGGCTVMTPGACAAAGGSYQGDGVACGGQEYVEASCSDALIDISATGTLAATASGCDDCGEVVALPFPFTFYGNTYNSIGIASNGYLTFGGTLGDFSNDAIPNAFVPNDIICPAWDDWHTGNFGDVYYQTLAGPARFVVMWNQVARFGNAGSRNTFEAILYTDGSIDFRYGDIDVANSSMTVGIENSTGTIGLALSDPGSGNTCRSIDVELTNDPCSASCLGDLDNDGDRDISDLALLLSQFGQLGPGLAGDIDGDGDVDISDLAQLLSVYGVPC